LATRGGGREVSNKTRPQLYNIFVFGHKGGGGGGGSKLRPQVSIKNSLQIPKMNNFKHINIQYIYDASLSLFKEVVT
jgi:hypothetical protein